MSKDKREVKVVDVHWADNFAKKAIDASPKEKEYIVESGVTPSGIIHVGHFREMITMEMVRRALEDKGKNAKFLYSWDSFDAFRKVPPTMPKEYEKYLRLPLVKVPDPHKKANSYGEYYIEEGEKALSVFDFPIVFQNQHELYPSGIYADGIKKLLEFEAEGSLQEILNRYRHEPLANDWTCLTLFCEKCNKDTTKISNYDGEYTLDYECECGHKNTINFKKIPIVKPKYRADWPMRWDYYGVNVEGGGKDYSTPGSPWFSGNDILTELFKRPSLIGPFHNFVGMKGEGGKISSSKGEGATITDLMHVYEKEVILFLFAGTRPNAEFDISFDIDVIKIYEDFDKLERVYYGLVEEKNPKKLATLKRTYELSMLGRTQKERAPQKEMPIQPSFRHLTTLAQANDFVFEKVKALYKDELKTDFDEKRLKERFECASNWVKEFAPTDMKFHFNDKAPKVTGNEKKIIEELIPHIEKESDPKELGLKFKEVMEDNDIQTGDFFKLMYTILINKEKGPKLAGFITENKEKVITLLKQI